MYLGGKCSAAGSDTIGGVGRAVARDDTASLQSEVGGRLPRTCLPAAVYARLVTLFKTLSSSAFTPGYTAPTCGWQSVWVLVASALPFSVFTLICGGARRTEDVAVGQSEAVSGVCTDAHTHVMCCNNILLVFSRSLASSSTRGACLAKRHTTSSFPLPRGARAASASLVDLEGYLREQEGAGPGRHGGAGSPREQVGGGRGRVCVRVGRVGVPWYKCCVVLLRCCSGQRRLGCGCVV